MNIILDHIGVSDKSNIIAYACLKTNYGKSIYANNLFLNGWHEGCGFPFKEVFVNGTKQKIRIKKYDSWETCLKDTPDIEDSPVIGGIARLYNLGQYNL